MEKIAPHIKIGNGVSGDMQSEKSRLVRSREQLLEPKSSIES